MNETVATIARTHLKDLLNQVEQRHLNRFNRMYSHSNLNASIDEVVDNMPDENIDLAISQCERTIEKMNT